MFFVIIYVFCLGFFSQICVNCNEKWTWRSFIRVWGAFGLDLSDVRLTGSLQQDWADTTVCICVVQRPLSCPDHVVGSIQRPSVACTPATSARSRDHHPLCSSLVDIMLLLVLHEGHQPEVLPHRHHPVRETARPPGPGAQRGPQARGSVSWGAVRSATCGREAFHAPGAAVLLVGRKECHPLHARVSSEHPQHCAGDYDAHMVHLQPGHGGSVHPGPEWGLSVSEHLRSDGWRWVTVFTPVLMLWSLWSACVCVIVATRGLICHLMKMS